MKGFVIFNKPKNYTSFQVVEYFKKLTNDKVGHGGTLDPIAEGVLILGIGKDYTKMLGEILKNSRKVYIGEIILGYVSNTYDAEGEIKKITDELPNFEKINEVIKNFVGKIKQRPPKFSAIKIKGKRGYELARKGKDFEIPEKEVEIYNLEILDYLPPKLLLKAEVQSGVYIRSLANDIGEKLGCGGYLNNLKRVAIINNPPGYKPDNSPGYKPDLSVSHLGNLSASHPGSTFTIDEAISFEDIEKDYLELYAKIYGIVQGVGFRYFVYKNAKNLNILGYVKNLEDGTVEVLAQGKEKDLQKLIEYLEKGPILSKVEKLDLIFKKPLKIYYNFEIR
jgi:tRNA pseudouridine55 synthase